MELFGYHLDFEELLPRIKAEHPGLEAIGLQFPDGLRDHAPHIAEIVAVQDTNPAIPYARQVKEK